MSWRQGMLLLLDYNSLISESHRTCESLMRRQRWRPLFSHHTSNQTIQPNCPSGRSNPLDQAAISTHLTKRTIQPTWSSGRSNPLDQADDPTHLTKQTSNPLAQADDPIHLLKRTFQPTWPSGRANPLAQAGKWVGSILMKLSEIMALTLGWNKFYEPLRNTLPSSWRLTSSWGKAPKIKSVGEVVLILFSISNSAF